MAAACACSAGVKGGGFLQIGTKRKLITGTVLFFLGLIWYAVSFDIPYFSGFGVGGFNPKSIPVALSIGVTSAGSYIFLGGAKEAVGVTEDDAGSGE